MGVCLFVWYDRVQILCGTLHVPREGLWMIKISKICLQQNSISINKKNEIFYKIRKLFFLVLYYNEYKEKMFPIEI